MWNYNKDEDNSLKTLNNTKFNKFSCFKKDYVFLILMNK